ncbi:MAG: hypothetical protein V1709_05975 [Planctomycetota bacterium]
MIKNRWSMAIGFLLAMACIMSFNYGCGGKDSGGNNSGSSVLTQVTSPNPSNGAINVITSTQLSWASVNNATSYDVYFGTGSNPPYKTNTISRSYNPGTLSYGITYYWRIDSRNSIGTTTGNVWSFTTQTLPPTCTTNSATNVITDTATLNGTVNPNGANVTSCYFDYGTSESYGISVTVVSLPGSGTIPVSVTANVSSLSISTTYNFRVVATNAKGTTNGNNRTFTTVSTTAVDDYVWVTNSGSGSGNTVTRIQKVDLSTTTITVGNYPLGVAVDDTYVWVANYNSNTVTRIQKSNPTITDTITVGTRPSGVTVDETYCWVANSGAGSGNTVTRITKSILSTTTITVGTGPRGVAVDATYCWVTNYDSNNITCILKSDLSTTTIAVGTNPWGVAVDETYCWVANAVSNNVFRILKSDTAVSTTVAAATSPTGVAVDETYCWVSISSSNKVYRILKVDLNTTMITVGSFPYGVAVDGTYCWVANAYSNNVTRILKADLSTTTIAVGTDPYSVGDMTGYAYDNYSLVP